MVAVFFVYGLAFFCLGLAVLLETRRASELPLVQQLPWLAAFGILHSLVEWSDMLLLSGTVHPADHILEIGRTILLPISALCLIRFGVGLIAEKGPWPRWLIFVPVLLLTPAALLVAYALITAATESLVTADIWSRYLLYLPGNLLSAYGFIRQRRDLTGAGLHQARNLMLGAAVALFFNALVAGLIVPEGSYGFAPWLNYETVLAATHIPVQFLRMLSAVAVTVLIIRALGVFETERKQRLAILQAERERALETVQESEARFRTIFEMAPIGMDIVAPSGRPVQANLALQKMLGYSAAELREMVFTDYTHPDDVAPSQRLVREVIEGKRDHFRMEKRYYTKNENLVWGNVAVSGVRDPEGKLLYFIAMVEDITERKRIERALQAERDIRMQALTEARQTSEDWAMSLVDVSRRIANMESVDDVLLHIVKQVRRLLRSDLVSVALLDDSGSQLELKCRVVRDRADTIDPPLTLQNELLFEVLRDGHSYRFPEESEKPTPDWYCPTVAEKLKAAAVVPLQFDGQLVGGLWAGRFAAESFAPGELIELESMADQAVIALQHASMAARLQSLAVLEERSRIAREMHDGLAQILGYLGLQVQTLDALVRRGDNKKVLDELRQTRDNIKLAQADVRENILSLRTTLSAEAGIVPALQEYVAEFGVQTATTARLDNQVQGNLTLSPLAEVQLVRIVQEALANIRKHAWAECVDVTLAIRNGHLLVAIADDGRGFELPVGGRQFGLQTMRERAESVGGRLSIHSAPNWGTRVELRLPLLVE
jgi:PAS domain S-box-containing protein